MKTVRLFAFIVALVAMTVAGTIPASAQPEACQPYTHIVGDGESLLSVAKAYDMSPLLLAQQSGLTSNVVRIGDSLVVIPCEGSAVVPTAPVEDEVIEDTPAPVVADETVTQSTSDVPFAITGAQASVSAENVEVAHGDFINTIGLGSEMILAEPGVLLTHDATEAEIARAEGSIDRFNPLNQFPLNNEESTQTGCGESRFVQAVGNTMSVQIETVKIDLHGAEGRNWFIVIRCRYSDGLADTDAGGAIQFSNYVPGFAQVMLLPAGGFVSEQAFMQGVDISTSTYSCGSESCSDLNVFFYDVNTQAYNVLSYTRDGGWKNIATNIVDANAAG